MTFQLTIERRALKAFQALDSTQQRRFAAAFDELRQQGPLSGSRLDIKPLEGRHGLWRLRVGGYRAIFEIRGDVIFVTRIGDRKNIYRT